MEAFGLDGKVALITGAAQGIGEAIARLFAEVGADLALCDRNGELLAKVADAIRVGTSARVHAVELDIRDADTCTHFVDDVARVLGGIDVVVNNAGGGFGALFVDTSAKGEAALISENYTSAAHLIRLTVPHMRGRGGAIVNITSIEAHRAAPGYATYAAMKAAIANLTMSLALELGVHQIRVNCVAPDMIPTPGIAPDADRPLAVDTPLPYAGSPLDVAHAALFLATDASRFVTGTTLHVDGGNRAAAGWRRQADGSYST